MLNYKKLQPQKAIVNNLFFINYKNSFLHFILYVLKELFSQSSGICHFSSTGVYSDYTEYMKIQSCEQQSFFEHVFEHINAPFSDLSWKSEICSPED